MAARLRPARLGRHWPSSGAAHFTATLCLFALAQVVDEADKLVDGWHRSGADIGSQMRAQSIAIRPDPRVQRRMAGREGRARSFCWLCFKAAFAALILSRGPTRSCFVERDRVADHQGPTPENPNSCGSKRLKAGRRDEWQLVGATARPSKLTLG